MFKNSLSLQKEEKKMGVNLLELLEAEKLKIKLDRTKNVKIKFDRSKNVNINVE